MRLCRTLRFSGKQIRVPEKKSQKNFKELAVNYLVYVFIICFLAERVTIIYVGNLF